MTTSAIKGSAFESIVLDVNRLVDEKQISSAELEAQLTADDLRILDSKIQAALWYPIETFGRLTEVLLHKEGRGDFGYLIDRGRRAAQRLMDSGIYSQLSASAEVLGDRVGRVMVTIGPAMYRGTEWEYTTEVVGDQRKFLISVKMLADFPDVCRYPTLGFIEHLARHATDDSSRVTSRRDSPTLMSFLGRSDIR